MEQSSELFECLLGNKAVASEECRQGKGHHNDSQRAAHLLRLLDDHHLQ